MDRDQDQHQSVEAIFQHQQLHNVLWDQFSLKDRLALRLVSPAVDDSFLRHCGESVSEFFNKGESYETPTKILSIVTTGNGGNSGRNVSGSRVYNQGCRFGLKELAEYDTTQKSTKAPSQVNYVYTKEGQREARNEMLTYTNVLVSSLPRQSVEAYRFVDTITHVCWQPSIPIGLNAIGFCVEHAAYITHLDLSGHPSIFDEALLSMHTDCLTNVNLSHCDDLGDLFIQQLASESKNLIEFRAAGNSELRANTIDTIKQRKTKLIYIVLNPANESPMLVEPTN